MQFNEQLNEYISGLNTNSKELSDASGLSPSVISRYRSGKRIPSEHSKQINMLAEGIACIGKAQGTRSISTEDVYNKLLQCIEDSSAYTSHQANRLNTLIDILKINTVDMARAINYDSSYISRVRSRKRIPTNAEAFIRQISSYVAKTFVTDDDIRIISECIGCTVERLQTIDIRQVMLEQWLSEKSHELTPSPMHDFLTEIDEFDLDEYMRKIHFDDIKIMEIPFSLPSSKNYYGIEAMKDAELDFIKATVLSRSKKPVYMYSDMPMYEMGKDEDFKKKYILGIGMMIRKGLHINVIHNINRPLDEMMMGLIGYIPLYMTGQISPYYFNCIANPIFSQLNNVSGAAALEGQCVNEHHSDGKYYLTNNKRELEYFHTKALNMLSTAFPLMEIYRGEQKTDFMNIWNTISESSRTIRRISYSLPIFTIPYQLLKDILIRNEIPVEVQKALLTDIDKQRNYIENIVKQGTFHDIVCDISDNEFATHPPCLSLSSFFFEKTIPYTPEDYMKHMEATVAYSNRHERYNFQITKNYDFRNIQITLSPKDWVMISKNQSPAIHFVVKHPTLMNSLEKMIMKFF